MKFISVLLESDFILVKVIILQLCAMVSAFSTWQNKNFTLSQLVLLCVDVPMPVLAH